MSQPYDVAATRRPLPAAKHIVDLDSGFRKPLTRPVSAADRLDGVRRNRISPRRDGIRISPGMFNAAPDIDRLIGAGTMPSP